MGSLGKPLILNYNYYIHILLINMNSLIIYMLYIMLWISENSKLIIRDDKLDMRDDELDMRDNQVALSEVAKGGTHVGSMRKSCG